MRAHTYTHIHIHICMSQTRQLTSSRCGNPPPPLHCKDHIRIDNPPFICPSGIKLLTSTATPYHLLSLICFLFSSLPLVSALSSLVLHHRQMSSLPLYFSSLFFNPVLHIPAPSTTTKIIREKGANKSNVEDDCFDDGNST